MHVDTLANGLNLYLSEILQPSRAAAANMYVLIPFMTLWMRPKEKRDICLKILSPLCWSLPGQENGLQEPAFVHYLIAIMGNVTYILIMMRHEKPACSGES